MKLKDIYNKIISENTWNGETVEYKSTQNINIEAYIEPDEIGDPYAKIYFIEIPENLRKNGVGKKEIDNFKKWAKSYGVGSIEVNNILDDAVPFWKKMGANINNNDLQDLEDGDKIHAWIEI
tara:strand:+ start:868 stop:1233 length:366 start_codon:yes stop_codon:yes gene_type:complete